MITVNKSKNEGIPQQFIYTYIYMRNMVISCCGKVLKSEKHKLAKQKAPTKPQDIRLFIAITGYSLSVFDRFL